MDRCVKSVVEQTYKELEIILVDDGSPDNCPAMCDEWSTRDSRIKVIHKENGGLSDARNAGVAIATGDYIGFVDGDDYINPDMYKIMMETMIDSGSEMVCCQYQEFIEGEDALGVLPHKGYHELDKVQALDSLIDNAEIRQVVWNKLYQKSVLQDILFLNGKYHEDEFWSYQVIGRINRVAIVDYIGYNYLQRKDSIMGVRYSSKRLDAIEAKVLRQQYFENNFPELAFKGKVNLLFSCLYQGQLTLKCLSGEEEKKVFECLRKVYAEHVPNAKEMKELSNAHKGWLNLARYCFVFTCRLRNFCNVGI